ncbi:chromosomal replication initiator protein DnaA [Patescibacteria group bacterium]|nr:chromosomal replication initiator protein DnaA [Patescibacteria group bacterium]
MDNDQLWQATLGEIELSLSKANFATWFKNTFISSQKDESIIVGVPSGFVKSWLEGKFHKELVNTMEKISGKKLKSVIYKIETRKDQTPINFLNNSVNISTISNTNSSTSVKSNYTGAKSGGLNAKYIFETFIKGSGNDLAYAACQAVANKPGQAYNPLFIYGGVGLGKTHLMQAIGHEVSKKGKRVHYGTCEQFTNDYINMIKNGEAKDFKSRYRDVDILLIDDIQFMAGKDGTQQEFFHTFNELHQADKQVVITSDRPPKSIPGLEKRLLSRFEWGMIADVVPPDIETKIAILESKCNEKNYLLDTDILYFLASNIQSNVRELEGALNRLIAYHEFNNTKPTIDSTKEVLSSIIANLQTKSKTPKSIIDVVSKYFDVTDKDIIGKCRKKDLVMPRQIIMYLMREECRASYPTIGDELGGRDHTTAMHACNKIIRELKENVKLKQDVESIRQMINDGAIR